MTARGWAVVQDGQINVRSVSPTRRGALVNWLITVGVMAFDYHTDDQIEAAWDANRLGNIMCSEVSIKVMR